MLLKNYYKLFKLFFITFYNTIIDIFCELYFVINSDARGIYPRSIKRKTEKSDKKFAMKSR